MPVPAPPNPLANAVAEFLAAQPTTSPVARVTRSAAPPAPAHLDLSTAYDKVVEDEALKAVPVVELLTRWRRFGRPATGGVVLAIAAWFWLLPPAWLSPPPDRAVVWPAGPSGTQLLLVNAADAIELFRRNTGRLPQGLEVDSVVPSLLLRPAPNGGFELQALDGTTLNAPPPAEQTVLGFEIASPLGAQP